MPKLSIIIPVYNGGETLNECLRSIFRQTFSDYEVIVCDGQSTDGTLEILADYRDKVILSSQKDGGVYDAMNRGVGLASGEWVYFIGADDCLASADVLRTVFDREYTSADLILGKAKHENSDTSKVPSIYRSTLSSKLLWRNSVHHQSAFYNRSVFREFQYNVDFKVLADYHLNLRLYKSGAVAVEIDELIAICDARGLSKQFNTDLYKEEVKVKASVLSPLSMLVQRVWIWVKFLWKNS